MPGARLVCSSKTCTCGGAGRFGAGSKEGGDGGVSCISVGDLLGLVCGSGSGLAGLSVTIGPAKRSLFTVEPASIIICSVPSLFLAGGDT